MKKQIRDNTRLENNLIRRERERNVLLDKDSHANVINEALEHNLTEEETGFVEIFVMYFVNFVFFKINF